MIQLPPPGRSLLARIALVSAVAAIGLASSASAAFADDPSPSPEPSTSASVAPDPSPSASASPSATPSGSPSASAAPSGAPGQIRGAGAINAVKNSYIVVLKNSKAKKTEVTTDATGLAKTYGGTVKHLYSSAVKGFAVSMTEAQAAKLAGNPAVAYVEQDHTVRKSDTQGDLNMSWGLDRVDQPFLPLDRGFTYPTGGTTVHAYVIDTGIRLDHQDFGGRATSGYDFVDKDTDASDCNGHGTHVAGTIGGTESGVAKSVDLVAVRVLDCDGLGSEADVVAGIDWVTANAIKPAVANMSLGGDSHSDAIDAAVNASIAAGITYAVAAGNDAVDACTESPADTPAALTVGATNEADFRASFSNYGSCVDIFAPGVNIVSAYIGDPTQFAYASGTSMASPHVAGAAALLLAANPDLTPAQVRSALLSNALGGTVHDAGTGSPSVLLRVGGTTPTTFGLRSHANNRIVTAESAGTKPLIASRYNVGAWEGFDLVDLGSGQVALRAHANNKYVTAEGAGTQPLVARATTVGDWEKYTEVVNGDGSISLQSLANNKYVTAESAGTKALIARSTTIGDWEKFDRVGVAAAIGMVAVNGRAVTAENAGAKPLIARSSVWGQWETYDLVDVGGGYVALYSYANGKYVTAANAGKSSLIASATAVGSWEKYRLISNPDGSISLLAAANSRYVTAESAGAKPLIARSTTIGDWEELWLIY